MLIYKNLNGEIKDVLKKLVARLSRECDLTANQKTITIIHLNNMEKIKSIDKIDKILIQLGYDKNKKYLINK